jgi:hypothetical protein
MGALAIEVGSDTCAQVWLRYDDRHLYAIWHVIDSSPLLNTGADPLLAFKTGDSVNLYVATDGSAGARVLLTVLGGKPVAVAYRPAGPGKKAFLFRSSMRDLKFDYVSEEADVTMEWKRLGTPGQPRDYVVVASIPWSVLGVVPRAGLRLRADVAVLFSDVRGQLTVRRAQWADRATGVVNDVVAEAELNPARWGVWILGK